MFIVTEVSQAATRRSRSKASLVRFALATVGVFGVFLGTGSPGAAQTTPPKPWEILVPSGIVIPTGDQRDAIKRANMTALQLSYVVRPALAITGTVGWARSRDIGSVDEPKLDVFTYDVGAEVRAPRVGGSITFRPFAGFGVGARSYNYRSLHVDATHNPAAYGSAGGEVGKGRLGLRVEVRDYLTGFAPLDGRGGSDARNDVVLMAGLRFARR